MFSVEIGSRGLIINGHQLATAEECDRAFSERRPPAVARPELLAAVTAAKPPAPRLAAAVTRFLNGAAVLDLEHELRPELRTMVSQLSDVAKTGEWAGGANVGG